MPLALALCLCSAAVAAAALETAAQNPASAALEFSVRAAPSTGRAEKVMRHPFFLLRASVKEIEAAAGEEVDPPDFDTFIDELTVSPELKAWMKEHHTTDLQGDKFLALLTPDDVLDIPEFRDAYVTRNLIMVGLGFPKRKAKLTDREKNPAKWEESEKRYWEEVRAYATLHPESRRGMDDHLLEINSNAEWHSRLERHQQRVHQKFLQLLHARYLVAKTETNYDGRARLADIPPGRYWLTTLDNDVRAGDVRLRWELPLQLEPGRTQYFELNNANAIYVSSQR